MGIGSSRDSTVAHHEGYAEGGPSTMWGSSYRSPYPYHKRDYDVHKKIWDPYVNRPSKAQRIFEVLSLLILLASVPAFLGGVLQVFVTFYAFLLGMLGLFAWPRRHMIIWILLSLCMIAFLIVSIILRATNTADCFPFVNNSSPQLYSEDVVGTSPVTVQPYLINTDWDSNFCGNRTLTYITHGILLGLIALALPFAIKIATERRRRFYDYDYVGAAPGAAAAPTMPTSGHTAVYNRPVMPTTGTTVAPATPVIATPVYAATNVVGMAPPAH